LFEQEKRQLLQEIERLKKSSAQLQPKTGASYSRK
jgi:hypothetical protein